MATLALSVVGSVVGNMILPGLGGVIGRGVGALAGAYIDSALIGATGQETASKNAPTISDIAVTTSTEGVDVPRCYGRSKIGGNIIWATYHEVETASSGGSSKGLGSGSGGSSTTEYKYYANFAIALCEGEITGIGRVWADSDELNLSLYTYRVYTGNETQTVDSLIEAKEGAGNAPAFRGIAYVVFERMPLNDFGNRIPNLNIEVFRAVDPFEDMVQGVVMIPASGEFAYHPIEVRVDNGSGGSYAENRHITTADSDFMASVDNLEASLPNCGAVSLFVAWFGSDLRCATCTCKPKVDSTVKNTTPILWGVSGLTRATAEEVSKVDTRPAYGGTPTDASVIAAIKEMRDERGLEVIFTPFLLLDIPDGNTLTDPYIGASTQPVYPWRGRITCSPAPGVSGTPDKTAAAQVQVDAFYGTVTASDFTIVPYDPWTGEATHVVYSGPSEWTYSRFVLHCAALCAAAGGVEAFVIGSEMRGLTWVRDSASTYPFVDALVSLAAQVAVLLPDAELTYAADWSEYFGHQPSDGSGDVYFHLDTLWSDPNIDAVAIDNYWPLSDWRDGDAHLDYVAGYRFVHDLNYLKAHIEGGEGYDWYYVSGSDRDAQTRTAITDGSGKPWVFRYKDIRSWWSNSHYNRPGGVESGTPTAWVAEGKPIWFTELGCPAIDKGTNQPNVFYDPKSSESAVPYYSRGTRDDLIQRRYTRAFLEWYDPTHPDFVATQNPSSGVYSGRMVDVSRIMLYTWDARPYPAYPALTSFWSDGLNWQYGHWLTGRMACAPIADLIARMLDDVGFADYDVDQLTGVVAGYMLNSVTSPRDAIQPLETAFFFDSFESGGALRFAHRGRAGIAAALTLDDLVETRVGQALYDLKRGQETDLPAVAKVTYIDSDQGYEQSAAEGRRLAGGSGRVSSARLPISMSYDDARALAEKLVHDAWATREQATFTLPPSRLALDPSDVVTLAISNRAQKLRITGATCGAGGVAIEARSIEPQLYDPAAIASRNMSSTEAVSYGTPLLLWLDLPLITGEEVAHAGRFAAYADPWPQGVAVYRSPSTSGYTLNKLLTSRATVGLTGTAFYSGTTGRWDNGNVLRVTLSAGQLASADAVLVLGGENIAAIENADGEWEVIQFATATLVSELTYDLSGLLRGQFGTEGAMRSPVAAGARFVLLNTAVVQAEMTAADVGLDYNWKYGPANYDIGSSTYATELERSFDGVGLRPLSPCSVRGVWSGSDIVLTWKRRTRIGGDSWEQTEVPLSEDSEAYEVDIMSGATVKRTLTVATATATYTFAQQIADFGSAQTNYTVRVYQMSASYGRGQRREAVVP